MSSTPLSPALDRRGIGRLLCRDDSARAETVTAGRRQSHCCVSPTALLSEQALNSIPDQQNQTLNQDDCCHARDGKHQGVSRFVMTYKPLGLHGQGPIKN
jgi:hypothetical protein